MDEDEEENECDTCYGDEVVDCSICEGYGKVGDKVCDECLGDGEIDCPECC